MMIYRHDNRYISYGVSTTEWKIKILNVWWKAFTFLTWWKDSTTAKPLTIRPSKHLQFLNQNQFLGIFKP